MTVEQVVIALQGFGEWAISHIDQLIAIVIASGVSIASVFATFKGLIMAFSNKKMVKNITTSFKPLKNWIKNKVTIPIKNQITRRFNRLENILNARLDKIEADNNARWEAVFNASGQESVKSSYESLVANVSVDMPIYEKELEEEIEEEQEVEEVKKPKEKKAKKAKKAVENVKRTLV